MSGECEKCWEHTLDCRCDVKNEFKEQLETYKMIKKELIGMDYEDISLQSSYRKLRHHLDQIIVKIEKVVEQC